ncbi:MAG: xly 2 [Bacteroidetes bacterium]|jgi:hypothetical protein|nr:xly 2 [Bacteroidota bacterium]
MKKILSIITMLIIASVTSAQTNANFQFKFFNAAGGLLQTTIPTAASHATVTRIDVDLSASVCQGDFIKIGNLTTGTYVNAGVTKPIDHSILWDGAWGWWGAPTQSNSTVSWGGNSYSFYSQQWDKPSFPGSTTYLPLDIQIPTSGEYVGSTISYTIAPNTYQVNLLGTIGGNYDPNYVKYVLLVSPNLQNSYGHIDLAQAPVPHQNIGCGASVIAIVIKVKRAPKPLADKYICQGDPVSVTIPAGVTASNWQPANPTVTPPTTTTTYTVSLTNTINGGPGCTIQAPFTVHVYGHQSLPVIQGNSTFCSGQPITFLGKDNSLDPNNPPYGYAHEGQWEITECSSTGTPIGSSLYNSGFDGAYLNTNFSFPIPAVCGKYYKLKYSLREYTEQECFRIHFVEKVIYIACTPLVSYDGNTTVCLGSSTTLCASYGKNCSVQWKMGRQTYNTPCMTITPTANTTVTLTVTNAAGCSTIISIPITVIPNDPSFTFIDLITTNPAYFTITAVPNDLSAIFQPGMGYVWKLEDLDAGGNSIFLIDNSYCWWGWSTSNPTNYKNPFNGFDHVANNYTGLTTLSNGASPANGKFLYNHQYRVTRGTWNDACPWDQDAYIMNYIKAMDGTSQVVFIRDENAPDISYLKNNSGNKNDIAENVDMSIYPNPSNGVYTIEMDFGSKATIEVYDVQGKKVRSFEQTGPKSVLDLKGAPKGMYMVRVISEGKMISKKIILE